MIDLEFVSECYKIAFTTIAMLIFCEILCWDATWKNELSKNWDLYKEAIISNLHHYFIVGPLAYGFAIMVVHRLGETNPTWIALPGVLATQGIGYACAHKWMHKPENYWIHKFHHSFNDKSFVRPISANSVTLAEFTIAYSAPIVTGICLFRPDVNATYWVVTLISATNLLIHTPNRCLPMGWVPDVFVTNLKHFHHHEQNLQKHYSAPIFDLDNVLGISSKGRPQRAHQAEAVASKSSSKSSPKGGTQSRTTGLRTSPRLSNKQH